MFQICFNVWFDVVRRVAGATDALQILRKVAFRNQALGLGTKRFLLQGVVVSRLLFGSSCVWGRMSQKAVRVLSSFYTRTCRTASGTLTRGDGHDVPTQQVIAELGVPGVNEQLRQQRLLHFLHVALTAPRVLLNLLRLEYASRSDSWLHLVEDDVSWMRAHTGNWLACMSHPFEPDRALALQQKTWRRAVRQATYTSICQARMWSDIAACRKQISKLLCEAGATFHAAAQPTAHQDSKCPNCSKTFSNMHRLRMRRTVQHKERSEAASYAESTHSPICLVEFWSTQRLLVHFRSPSQRSAACCLATHCD